MVIYFLSFNPKIQVWHYCILLSFIQHLNFPDELIELLHYIFESYVICFPGDNFVFLFHDSRYSITKAFCVAFVLTFFSAFDVPVFWPILLCYWIVLFILTMKRQIVHMIKYKYVPFSMGKQVSFKS